MERIISTVAQSAPGFLLAIVFHEWAHGYAAKIFGDDTAERSGRLTFNPAAHIDMMGTIIFPLIGVMIGGMAFGWAKPVPVNARNFRDIRKATFWVSFAGPLANLILGIVSAFLYVLLIKRIPEFAIKGSLSQILYFSIYINFILMGFNLIPLPPLDGSKMVASFLKGEALRTYEGIAQYTQYIFIGAIMLSFAGVHIFGYLLMPFMAIGQFAMGIFNFIL